MSAGLTTSGALIVAMSFLVMPTLTRPLSRFFAQVRGQKSVASDDRPPMHSTQDLGDPDQAVERAAPKRNVADLYLRTDRLELRALRFDDLDQLASMLGDAEGLTYWGPPLTREQSRLWIERNLRRYEQDGFGRCAVILQSTGELVGDCGLVRMLIEGQPVVELGWIVRRDHRGKGIAVEAAVAWRDYAFDTLGLERIVSMVSKKNVASRRVAEKIGMTIEREAMMDGLPHLMYSMRHDLGNRP